MVLVDPSGRAAVGAGAVAIGLSAAAAGAYVACFLPYIESAQADPNYNTDDSLMHCWVSCMASRVCGKLIAKVGGDFKELVDMARSGVIIDILSDSNINVNPQQQEAVRDFLMDEDANQYGRDVAGWETNIPLGGLVGRWFRQSCDCACTSGRNQY